MITRTDHRLERASRCLQCVLRAVGCDRLEALAVTAEKLGLSTGDPGITRALPFAAYGQGPVLVTPFKMARVAATIASGGRMPQGRWIAGDGNVRVDAPLEVLAPEHAAFLAGAMRRVVTEGTARRVMAGSAVEIAGKTGTAQLDSGMPHAWFTGLPVEALRKALRRGGGGTAGRRTVAAPIAREVMEKANIGFAAMTEFLEEGRTISRARWLEPALESGNWPRSASPCWTGASPPYSGARFVRLARHVRESRACRTGFANDTERDSGICARTACGFRQLQVDVGRDRLPLPNEPWLTVSVDRKRREGGRQRIGSSVAARRNCRRGAVHIGRAMYRNGGTRRNDLGCRGYG